MRMTPLHGAALRCAAAALAAVASLGADPAAAAPRATGDLKLTLVARVCASYSDVMANRQRDDNMQSLQNLGKDSVYSEGQPVAPDVEAANDPNCTPLTGWRFSLGSGIGGEVQGLSTVTPAPDGLTRATTLASVPELDANRNDTGRILAGAVTVDLDDSLIAVARNRRLQIQGGAPTDPLNQQLLGNTYSFATLRCAVDNQRADNVDRAAYPTGSSHVFCYYYAVRQPAEPGTVVVRKHVLGTAAARPFAFDGDLSYNPGGLFQLTAGPRCRRRAVLPSGTERRDRATVDGAGAGARRLDHDRPRLHLRQRHQHDYDFGPPGLRHPGRRRHRHLRLHRRAERHRRPRSPCSSRPPAARADRSASPPRTAPPSARPAPPGRTLRSTSGRRTSRPADTPSPRRSRRAGRSARSPARARPPPTPPTASPSTSRRVAPPAPSPTPDRNPPPPSPDTVTEPHAYAPPDTDADADRRSDGFAAADRTGTGTPRDRCHRPRGARGRSGRSRALRCGPGSSSPPVAATDSLRT
ncbi:hypothetical protein GCM10020229_71340 [Kitasatospora albolonga]